MSDVIGQICEPPVVIGASLATASLFVRRAPDIAAQLAIATPLAVGITKLLKMTVDEHRPRFLDTRPEQSFPSGHATAITAFTLSAVAASRRWWLLPVAAAAIAAVDYSRVSHREHWWRDVLVGNAVGLAGAGTGLAAAYAVRRWRRRASPASDP
jgi:membrane-associated phospholipid phosphatase